MVGHDRKSIRQIWPRQGGQDLNPSFSTVQPSPLEIRRSNKKSDTGCVEENLDRYADMSTDIHYDVFGLTGPNRENAGVSRYLGKFRCNTIRKEITMTTLIAKSRERVARILIKSYGRTWFREMAAPSHEASLASALQMDSA